ncbi:MAG: copper homeostasis protein CutC [Planctomycetes bacterium]|nr:copper homeostasis protein CutC [Planctomycetota bacterium]
MPLLEVCVDTIEKLRAAQQGGAQRFELCSRLDLDGLSPTDELLDEALEASKLPLYVMVRPRPGNFVHDDEEFRRMLREVDELRGMHVPGVVFGLLTRHHKIDVDRTRELVLAARPMQVTFHRAFDHAHDPLKSLDALIELKIERVLSSGGLADAWSGREKLRELVQHAAGRIGVVPAGNVRADHARELLESTLARELHSSTWFRMEPVAAES